MIGMWPTPQIRRLCDQIGANMKVLILVLLGVVALTSCTGTVVTFKFYVAIKPDETARFIGAVTALAKENGLETASNQVVADTGYASTALEGRGHGLKLWVQNVPMSGGEDPKLCGVHSEPYPDPAQFVVSTEPRFFGSRAAATTLGERIFSQLQKSGFDVRREPAICGAAAIHDRS
jgi:hypothetical protein